MLLPLLLLLTSSIPLLIPPTFAHPVAAPSGDLLSPFYGTNHSFVQTGIQKCGTHVPSPGLRDAHADFRERARVQKTKKERRGEVNEGPIVVQTYVHFVSTVDQSHRYPPSVRNAMIASQIAVLTTLYRPALISFRLISTTYTVHDAWATDAASSAMKSALRRGNYESLNLYFQTNLSTPPYTYNTGGSFLLGYCTLPTDVTYVQEVDNGSGGEGGEVVKEYPMRDYAGDGCNVLAGSMPRAPVPVGGYSLGKTAVHEVGHWFGLLHTFQDNTCATSDPGDYVDDTPQQSQSTTGCPTGKDSCPGDPGVDPISNYMDYSTDECYAKFSPDQLARMRDMFGRFRLGY